MDGYSDTGPSSRAEGTRRRSDDVIRRQASRGDDVIRRQASRGNDAESSTRTIDRTGLDQMEVGRTQAIERGRAKLQKYQQEAMHYQHKDRDTFKDFKRKFTTERPIVKSDRFLVNSKYINGGEYRNAIGIEQGLIISNNNNSLKYGEKTKFNYSEIIFSQLMITLKEAKKDISQFDLKKWRGQIITNKDTQNIVKLFFPEETVPGGLVKEGKKTFQAGDDGFIALAGTETGQSKFFLVAQHPKAFKGKRVTSITVIRRSDNILCIDYDYGL